MRRPARTLCSVFVTVVMAAVLAGCGGDDSTSPADTGAETSGGEARYPTETEETGETERSVTTPKPSPPAPAGPRKVVIVVDGGRPRGGIRQIEAKRGERLVIVVRADAGESVHLHGYDLERPVQPGRPTRIPVRATIPGRFELELHHPDALLARLTVRQ